MPATAIILRPTFTDVDSLPSTTFNQHTVVSVTVPDATALAEGVVRLAGDLAGTAASPQLAALLTVTAGEYGADDATPVLTVDVKGRVTAITNRAPKDTGVTAGNYGNTGVNVPNLNIDAKGRVVSAANRNIAQEFFQLLYPVGEILITHRAGNPNTWLGFGTWVAHGAGRALVGLDTADVTFDAIDKTAGSKTHTLTTAELPAHSHGVGTIAASANLGHTHDIQLDYGTTDTATLFGSAPDIATNIGLSTKTTDTGGAHSHTMSGDTAPAGSGTAHNNIQPSIVVAIWRRTA